MTLPAFVLAPLLADDNIGGGFWMPPRASTLADPVDRMFFFIYWICVFFFVLIVALMALFVIKYRRRPEVRPDQTLTHHTALELTWTVIPLILVIVIFYLGLRGYADIAETPANAYEVYVTGQKWSWTFEHRNGATETAQLTVPANRPVKLLMTSLDVLHAVYIPAFRVKQDAVPGRYTTLWFQADPGTYQLFCAEYCGTQHSQMNAIVHVLPEEEFQVAIEQAANWIDDYADEDLPRAGLRLYARCVSCHTLDGTTLQGPSFQLTHGLWGKPRTLEDGREVIVDENYVRDSILNPQVDIVANFPNVMPTFKGQLKEREIQALIELIKRFDEVVDETGQPIE